MLYVVGLGPGEVIYLTEAGKQAIEKSQILIGGERHLESQPDFKGEKRLLVWSDLRGMVDFIKANQKDKEITILASGDPLIYGIGKYLASYFTKEEMEIIPGISAIQYFFSKIHLDMNDLYITSSHGKTPNFDRLLSMEKVAMVTDKKVGPSEIAEEIIARGLKKILWIGENLSYSNERIHQLRPEEVVGKAFEMNVVVVVDEK